MFEIKRLQKKLLAWYGKNARDLPWRRTRDPYKIWISEVMLQQTTVAAVIPYYERWTRLFPTLKEVARAPLTKVLKSWQGLGYYARARHIHKTAQIIESEYAGRFPDQLDILRRLPGFGPYTTGAVSSIAFGLRVPIVDANIRRVVMRWKAMKGSSTRFSDEKIHSFLRVLLPQDGAGIFNQALMELGALVCRANGPLCAQCPASAFCSAYKQGLQDVIPGIKKNRQEKIEVLSALIEHRGRYFMQQRAARGLLAGLWEFPTIKVERGKKALDALTLGLKRELGVSLVGAEYLGKLRHSYTRFQVSLYVWHARLSGAPRSDRRHKWMGLKEMKKYPMPSVAEKIIKKWIKCL